MRLPHYLYRTPSGNGWSRHYASSVERGTLRLYTFQLWEWVHACGSDLEAFGRQLEARLAAFVPAPAKKRVVTRRSRPRPRTGK